MSRAAIPAADDKTFAAGLVPLAYGDLPAWSHDDHAAALAAFQRGAGALADHPPKGRPLGADAAALARLLRQSRDTAPGDARRFFEASFRPHAVAPSDGSGPFFTGYYEPEVEGSRVETRVFRHPLYRPPADLVEIEPGSVPGLPADFRFARIVGSGHREHYDRAAVAAGALAGEGLELAWLRDPVDAFFIHVQGSARIRLTDGTTMRITYAAKSGHPYTSIGRILVERGALTREAATMAGIRQWLAGHPAQAAGVMNANRSFIYFREADGLDANLGPLGAAKVQLTAGRSLAVDRRLYTFHTPVWVEAALPTGAPLRALMIAQDTGSAIVGAARGDIFFGSGEEAGSVAGAMRSGGRFVVLWPRAAL